MFRMVIEDPKPGAYVGHKVSLCGRYEGTLSDYVMRTVVAPQTHPQLHPRTGTLNLLNGKWQGVTYIGNESVNTHTGERFTIKIVRCTPEADDEFDRYFERVKTHGYIGWDELPLGCKILCEVQVVRNDKMARLAEKEKMPSKSKKASAATDSRKTLKRKQYIADIDLVGYKDITKLLQESIGSEAVKALNYQIQTFILQAVKKIKHPPEKTPYKMAGDGGILAFDKAQEAVRFAEALHQATQEHNCGKRDIIAVRCFRIGIAHGEISIEPGTPSAGDLWECEFHGDVVGHATRLQAACENNETLICPQTFGALSKKLKNYFGAEEKVKGKRAETFNAHRQQFADKADQEKPCSSNTSQANLMITPIDAKPGQIIDRKPFINSVGIPCLRCGHENDPGDMYCQNCRLYLRNDE